MKAHHGSLSAYCKKIMLVLARKSRFIIMLASNFSLFYFGRTSRDLMRKTALNFRTGNYVDESVPLDSNNSRCALRLRVQKKTCPSESRLITFSYLRELCRTDCHGVCIVYKRGTNRGNRLILPSG